MADDKPIGEVTMGWHLVVMPCWESLQFVFHLRLCPAIDILITDIPQT